MSLFGVFEVFVFYRIRIKSKCGKIKTRKISNTGTFHAVKDSAMTLHRLQFLYC